MSNRNRVDLVKMSADEYAQMHSNKPWWLPISMDPYYQYLYKSWHVSGWITSWTENGIHYRGVIRGDGYIVYKNKTAAQYKEPDDAYTQNGYLKEIL